MARVLIVEDMVLIAMELEDTLEELGHKVIGVAATVDAALEHLTTATAAPDFVILDANLRGDSSAPVAMKLRERHIPFIVTSGYGREMLDEIIVDEPRLTKPVSDRQLQEAISELLHGGSA